MKRGLKERVLRGPADSVQVTTYSPMKRGLKASRNTYHERIDRRYNLFPDEKGTESIRIANNLPTVSTGYNLFPDEKGTERR